MSLQHAAYEGKLNEAGLGPTWTLGTAPLPLCMSGTHMCNKLHSLLPEQKPENGAQNLNGGQNAIRHVPTSAFRLDASSSSASGREIDEVS